MADATRMVIACAQFDLGWEDKAANYAKAAEMLREAKLPPGSLYVLPEMFATGFSMNVAKTAEPAGGPTHQFLSNLAKTNGVYVLGGVIQQGPDGKPRNESITFNPAGELVCRYAKMQPFVLGGEAEEYAAGNEIVQFEWNGLKVTPFVCYDLRFPELFRKAARMGTDLFVVIASWPSPRTYHWTSLLQARAIENQAFVLGNNRTGTDPKLEYQGRSQIIDYAGITLADADIRPGVIQATPDGHAMRQYRQKLPFLRDMRSDLVPSPGTPGEG